MGQFKIMGMLIGSIMFGSLIGIIATQVGDANISGTAKTLAALVTVFIVIGFLYYILKESGIKV